MSIRLERGDCRDVLVDLALDGVQFDACVTDPPYDLVSVVKRFGGANAAPAKHGRDGLFARQSRGFMGKQWDGTGVAFDPATWRLVYDVLKPGAHLLAFGGSRTYHRMAVAIEDAGFEIRDCVMWMYSQGFPKSHNVSLGLWKAVVACQSSANAPLVAQVSPSIHLHCDAGTGYIVAAPAVILPEGVPALLIQTGKAESSCVLTAIPLSVCPVEHMSWSTELSWPKASVASLDPRSMCITETSRKVTIESRTFSFLLSAITPGTTTQGMTLADGRPWNVATAVVSSPGELTNSPPIPTLTVLGAATSNPVKDNVQSGTSLKPAFEPIIVARKPLIGTVAENVLAHGTGALNIGACRIGAEGGCKSETAYSGAPGKHAFGAGLNDQRSPAIPGLGRWPANVIHDGSDEVLEAFAAYGESSSKARVGARPGKLYGCLGSFAGQDSVCMGHTDAGTAARFFYSAKASAKDRAGSKHPTVKPNALMRYLVRLVTPPGGTVLDPFCGSGSTLQGAFDEGFNAVGIEREAEYQADIQRRIDAMDTEGLLA